MPSDSCTSDPHARSREKKSYPQIMHIDDFSERLVIRLPLTDAAGVIFYGRIFELEQELFERWLELGGMELHEMLSGALTPTPIVHCSADFRLAVRAGDRLMVRISRVEIGKSSYSLEWTFTLDAQVVMSATVKRVGIDVASRNSVTLPEKLRAWIMHTQQCVTEK